MFENAKKSKHQGNLGVGMAIAYFTSQFYTVSIPLTDSQEYDLVVDIEGKLNKIQVKTSDCLRESGKYEVSLRSSGGNKTSHTYKEFDSNDVDFVFVLLGDGRKYFIPANVIESKNSLTIGTTGKYEDYRVY